MLRRLISPEHVSHRETRHLAQPAALTTIVLCGCLIIYGIHELFFGDMSVLPLALGTAGGIYAVILFYVIVRKPSHLQKLRWPTAIINAMCIGTGLLYLPTELDIIPQIIMILIAAITVILWDRTTTLIFLFLTLAFHIFLGGLFSYDFWPRLLNHATLVMLGIIVVETINRLSESTRSRIRRLESVNEFARKIVYSLETDEVMALVGAAVQNAIKGDTYFLGLTGDKETIEFNLIFDDGEFFPPTTAPIEGTLSGWVIRNQRSLFIPDMRDDVDFQGINSTLIGKKESNLSWMGVPMHAGHVNGVISVGSYSPNAFDRTDLELLENLAQHAALALDNAHHHADVEAQSHTDSLTNVYNHKYLLEVLGREAEQSHIECVPLSLIMLDVDHFKQYNDSYGHIIGDQVLTLLTEAIRTHINSTDSIGRWGGEEFAIILPNTNGAEALIVAERIQGTMNRLSLQGRDGKHLPVPTVSQGIAVFPAEVDDINRLIDLADQRLYVAKERGRNQIEPGASHWKSLSMEQKL